MAGLAFFDECTERVEDENGENIFINLQIYNHKIISQIIN